METETKTIITCFGKQGWRSVESTHLPSMKLRFDSRTRRDMWVDLLLVFNTAPRGFSPGTPVFPSTQKPAFSNSNSIWMQDLPEKPLSGEWSFLGKYHDLFIYLKRRERFCKNWELHSDNSDVYSDSSPMNRRTH